MEVSSMGELFTREQARAFMSDDALLKVLYLVVMDAANKWTLPIQNWAQILQQLEVYYGTRITEFV